jgi:LEA14-like dessication related protein
VRMRCWVYGLVSTALVLGTVGCSWLRSLCSNFHEPVLSFDRAELLDLNLHSVTIDLHWLLKNENPVGIDLASLSYAFAVENHPLISGHPPNGMKIQPNGISKLQFPAHVEFAALAQTVEIFLQKNTAHYEASGSIGVNTPIGVVTLPLSHDGQFTVPKLPEIHPIEPVLNSIDFSGAHLTFPLQVWNKNGFPLPFNGLSGSLTLGNSGVASSSIPQMNALAPNERRVVNVGVDVNFINAGLDVANAIQSRRVNLGYHGQLDVAGFKVPINVQQNFVIK